MIITVIFVSSALLLLLFLFYISRGRLSLGNSASAPALRTVDIEAFRNLVDLEEDEFLRSCLTPGKYRRIRRERLLAAESYVRTVSANAIILQRQAGEGQRSADPEVVKAGHELAQNAARLRLNCLQVLIQLWAAILLPNVNLSHVTFLDRYDRLAGSAARLRRLQARHSAAHLPLSA